MRALLLPNSAGTGFLMRWRTLQSTYLNSLTFWASTCQRRCWQSWNETRSVIPLTVHAVGRTSGATCRLQGCHRTIPHRPAYRLRSHRWPHTPLRFAPVCVPSHHRGFFLH
jgi:hypothetical protein